MWNENYYDGSGHIFNECSTVIIFINYYFNYGGHKWMLYHVCIRCMDKNENWKIFEARIFFFSFFLTIAMDCIIFSLSYNCLDVIWVLEEKYYEKYFTDSTFNEWHLINIIAIFLYQMKWVFFFIAEIVALTFFCLTLRFKIDYIWR